MGLFSEYRFFFLSFGFGWLGLLMCFFFFFYFLFSVMSFVGYDYRKERKGVDDDGEDDDGSLENFDENDI